MAKWTIGRGLDEYISQLGNLEFASTDMCGEAVYQGAAIVADKIRSNIAALPITKGITQADKDGLLAGFGIATMQNDGGFYNVKLGMDGYNTHVTKNYPQGKPNAMIARSIESGTSFAPKHPFIAPAVNATKAAAEAKMKTVIDMKIKSIVKE